VRGLRGGKTEECRGDLIARERRGELSGPDGIALGAHLAECQSCALTRQVFGELDDVSEVDLHDGARIERLSMAARRWVHQSRRPRARLWRRAWMARGPWRTLVFAAIVLLIGGTASATMWWFRRAQPVVKAIPHSADQSLSVPQFAPRLRQFAPRSLANPTPASQPWRPAEDQRAPMERRMAKAAEVMASASGLLRQASDARRSGDAERAIGLYRRLQRDFPRSSEATLSAVSLGGLLLDRRLPRAALTQFDGYLMASRGGVLIPEALYGRGRALGSLGDRQEERRTWDRLLNDFPDSAYGLFARRRLQELK
jgi:TolA-binding protein